jgi:hypothetical protein
MDCQCFFADEPAVNADKRATGSIFGAREDSAIHTPFLLTFSRIPAA